jgi:hypothetical protein
VSLAPETDVYSVKSVAVTPQKKLEIHGTALPNSYVTLYIYSTPIIVTVKTDSTGQWQYTLDRELETGEHKIYAATVDNSGKIVAKSTPIPFTKTAEAATLGSVPPLGIESVQGDDSAHRHIAHIYLRSAVSRREKFGVTHRSAVLAAWLSATVYCSDECAADRDGAPGRGYRA